MKRYGLGFWLLAGLGAACESSPEGGGGAGQGGYGTGGSNTGNAGGECLTSTQIIAAGYTGSVCAADGLTYWSFGEALDAGVCVLHCWTGSSPPAWNVCPDTGGSSCGTPCTGPGQCPAGSYCDMAMNLGLSSCEPIPGRTPHCTVPTTNANVCLHSGWFKTCPGVGGQGSGGDAAAGGACTDGCVALRAERPYYQYSYYSEGCGGG